MPTPSNWTLTPGAIRHFVPLFLQRQLSTHPLTEALHLNGFGYYPTAHHHQMQRSDHEDHLVLYCTAGGGTLSVISNDEKRQYAVHAGDVLLLPKATPHHYKADLKTPWTLYWAHFDGSLSQHYCRHIAGHEPRHLIHLGLSSLLISSFEHLFKASNTGYALTAYISASHTLGQILTSIATSSIPGPGTAHQENSFSTVTAHMESVIHTQLDLDTLARLAGLSKYHFIKKYKETYGYSPIQHFIHRKIERACQQLDTTALNISAVADSLGYDDPHYFSRLFKKVTGLSPQQYRALGRG